jgi:hypothetical protein
MTSRQISVALGALMALSVARAGERPPIIANEGAIRDKWMLAPGAKIANAEYPPQFAADGADVCLALGYLIKADGSTSDFQVLKQWNSVNAESEPTEGFWQAFAQAGANALAQWRFQARPEVESPVPTWTVATLAFQAGAPTPPAELRAHCAIPDLAEHMAAMKKKGDVDDLHRRQVEQDYREQDRRALEQIQRRAQQARQP